MSAIIMNRFKVFENKSQAAPSFSAPWLWVASIYVTFFSSTNYCRIDDTKLNKTILEWAQAAQAK